MVTTTYTAPGRFAGVVVMIEVLLRTEVGEASGSPWKGAQGVGEHGPTGPINTAAPPTKFLPVIVTSVPPNEEPVCGTTKSTSGAGLYVNWSADTAALGTGAPQLLPLVQEVSLVS